MLGFAKALGEFGATITFVAAIPGETLTLPTAIYQATQTPGGETRAIALCAVAAAIADRGGPGLRRDQPPRAEPARVGTPAGRRTADDNGFGCLARGGRRKAPTPRAAEVSPFR